MDRQANQRAALQRLTLNGADAAWGVDTVLPHDLAAAMAQYRDHPQRLGADIAANLRAMFSPGVAAAILERVATDLLEGV